MTDYPFSRIPRSLHELKQRGDKQIAEAHQEILKTRRVAYETAELHAETLRLHIRFHGPTLDQQLQRLV